MMRWVSEANRSNPVRENATPTFGKDGNLVLLADADGRLAWQTNTANNGVVGGVEFRCRADLYSGGVSSLHLDYSAANSSTGRGNGTC